jgi:hypothetical protein
MVNMGLHCYIETTQRGYRKMAENDNGIPENAADALFHKPGYPRLRLATAYVPPQMSAREMFTLREALQKGTLFPELYRPYPHHYKYPQDCEV